MVRRLYCAIPGVLLALVASVASAASWWGDLSSGTPYRWLVIDLVVGVIGCALVGLLQRWPVTVGVILGVLAVVGPTATPPANLAALQVAKERRFPTAVAVAAVGVAAHIIRGSWRPQAGLPFQWWLVLVLIGYSALVGWGGFARARRLVITGLRERAERAEAEQGRRIAEARTAERAAIAREMHDVLAHRLSLLATYAGALEYRPDAPPERLAHAAGVIRATVHQALEELRDVIALLREDTQDAPDRPLPALTDLPDLIEESRSVGTTVNLRDELSDLAALPSTTARTAYRVLQEALTNARKHAPGQPVSIALDGAPGTRLVIDVSNPLAGHAVSSIPGTATGLVGLTERVRLAGGQLDHQETYREFRLHAWLPWPT
jgi:signal transduction histidine kinase